ncbi:MAG: hypothetical protein CM1200mP20_00130 [Pseudomonadota bacterium]|nr:MAG: hypothetical protein CM1200mP20_00130 [Pseudomonadota bacterium]
MEPREPFLKLSGIRKSFVSDDGELIPVIDGVSMEIPAGEFVVFLGPSGCGKTTLMRIVGGLETCESGEVLLAGEKVTGPDRKKGMVFQAYTSFPWLTVQENVRFGTRYRDDIDKQTKGEVADHYLNWWGSRIFHTITSIGYPGECANALLLLERWLPIQMSCSWTSPSGHWMHRPVSFSRVSCWRSTAGNERRRYSSPMTSTSRLSLQTGFSCFPRGRRV